MMELHADVYESLVIYALQGDDAVYCFPILLALNRKFNEITIRVLRGMTASYKTLRSKEPYPINDMIKDDCITCIRLRVNGGWGICIFKSIGGLELQSFMPRCNGTKQIDVDDLVGWDGRSWMKVWWSWRRVSLRAFLRRLYPELWAYHRDPCTLRMWLSDSCSITDHVSATDPHERMLADICLAIIQPPYYTIGQRRR